MSKKEWEKLEEKNFEEYHKKYCEFMFNPNNSHKCELCPENEGMKGLNLKPCGQYNCWVDCHCK